MSDKRARHETQKSKHKNNKTVTNICTKKNNINLLAPHQQTKVDFKS